MTGLPWYAHYLEHYDRDTAHLTMMQHGAYRLLLDQYYKYGKPLPADVEQLHRVCRAFAEQERAAIAHVLAEFFVLKKDGFHQERADLELKKARKISAERSKAAKSRHKKVSAIAPPNAPAIAPANAVHLDTHLTPNNNKKKEVSKILSEKGKKNGTRVTSMSQEEMLARFQAAIARHLGREGWPIVASAVDVNDPCHEASIAVCKKAANEMGKGWPHQWV